MPDPFDRHSKNKWDWGQEPSRSQQRAQAATEPDRKTPGKKDKWAHCKSNGGKAHNFVPTIRHARMECRWIPAFNRSIKCWDDVCWHCAHEMACTFCGKVSSYSSPVCPDYPGSNSQREAALKKVAEYQARRDRALSQPQWRRKPPITGPTHYRKS